MRSGAPGPAPMKCTVTRRPRLAVEIAARRVEPRPVAGAPSRVVGCCRPGRGSACRPRRRSSAAERGDAQRSRRRGRDCGRRAPGVSGGAVPAGGSRAASASCVRPARRARVVERDDEIAGGRRLEPGCDHRPRGQQVGQRDGAEIVAERRAERARRRPASRETPGTDDDLDARASRRRALAVDQLEDQRGQAVDAGIARRDQRHAAPFARRGRGRAGRAPPPAPSVAVMQRLAGDRAARADRDRGR